MAKRKQAMRRLEKQTRKMLKAQKKILKGIARPSGPIAGAGALLVGLGYVAQRLGWGDKLEHAFTSLRDRMFPEDHAGHSSPPGESARS